MTQTNLRLGLAFALLLALLAACGCKGRSGATTNKGASPAEGAAAKASATSGDSSQPPAIAAVPGSEGPWRALLATDRSLPADDAGSPFLSVQDGRQVVRLPKGQRDHHIVLAQPLEDDFEVRLRLRWPGWETEQVPPRVKLGLRSQEGRMQKFVQTVWFLRKRQEFYDCTLRCSGGVVGTKFLDDKEVGRRREFEGPMYFTLDVDAPAHFEIVEHSIRPGTFQIAVTVNKAPPPSMTGMPFGPYGPMGPMGYPGMVQGMPPGMMPGGLPPGATGTGGPRPIGFGGIQPQLPAPSKLPPIKTFGASQEWQVPRTALSALNQRILTDLHVTESGDATSFGKSLQSGEFWVLRELPAGDWRTQVQVELPSMAQIVSGRQPCMLGLGLFPEDETGGQISMPAPSPHVSEPQSFSIDILRTGQKVVWKINGGSPRTLHVPTENKLKFGFWLAGGIQFQVKSFNVTPPAPDPPPDEPDGLSANIPRTRVWSDSTGVYQTRATFVRLESELVVLRKQDGEQVKVPLASLSATDQQIARRFAERDRQ